MHQTIKALTILKKLTELLINNILIVLNYIVSHMCASIKKALLFPPPKAANLYTTGLQGFGMLEAERKFIPPFCS